MLLFETFTVFVNIQNNMWSAFNAALAQMICQSYIFFNYPCPLLSFCVAMLFIFISRAAEVCYNSVLKSFGG